MPVKPEDIRKAAVIGAGTMGPGLALVFAMGGYRTALCDIREEALLTAMSVARSTLSLFAEKGLADPGGIETVLGRIEPCVSLEEAAGDADLVIEAVTEDREAKRALYEQLDRICPERAVIASNTSYLNIFELMPRRRLPRTVIAHWFAPPHIVPLVEVVRGEETARETVDLVMELLKKLDRVPVLLEKFIDGFCVNRLQRILGREIFFLLDNGYITPEMLDIAVKASIVPRSLVLGFVQRYDFTGLDLSWKNLQNPHYTEPPVDNAPRSLKERVERGELGVKTGKGFFDYSGRRLEDVLRERDEKLLEAFALAKKFIYDRI